MKHNQSWMMSAAVAAIALLTMTTGCSRPVAAGPRPNEKAAMEIRETLLAGGGGAASGGAAESTGTGWSTLKGRFKLVGTPPALPRVAADKDTEVCGKGGTVPNETLVLDSDQNIANIVVYAKAKRVHDSAKPLASPNDAEKLVFDQKQCIFLTRVLGCQVNQNIDVRNSDPVPHNTNISAVSGTPANNMIPTGQSSIYVPTAEEAIPIKVTCNIHPFMGAYMIPRKDKYFAVTKPDGTFEIPNLPAGEEVELQVWHERGAGPSGALVLADRKDLKWTNRGRFKVKMEENKPLELTLDVPVSAFK